MTKQEEPSVLKLAELWPRMEQIRKEHRRISNLDPATFEGDERKEQKLAKLESEHLAVLEALGIADDELFDPFEDVPRPTSAQQALVVKPPPATPQTNAAEQRQAYRWQLCVDAGLDMPTDTYAHYPPGIGKVAKKLGITRQALAEDLNAHRERLFPN